MRRKNVVTEYYFKSEGFDLKNIIFRQSEIVDNFIEEVIETPDKKKVVFSTDPVIVLLNQERLDKLVGNTTVQSFIDSFRNQQYDPFAELRQQCSDDDLKALVKSRHLQAPAEILSWCKHMKENMDTFTSEVQKLVEAQQSQQEKKVETTEKTE